MKLSVTLVVLNLLLVATNGANDHSSFRGGGDEKQRELEDVNFGSYTGTAEITFELVSGGAVRNRNLGEQGDALLTLTRALKECEGSADPEDCVEDATLGDPNDPRALQATESVKGKALGLGGLDALSKALKRKITKDETLMEGFEVDSVSVSYQEVLDVEDEAASGRRLYGWGGNFVTIYTQFSGRCPFNMCGYDDNDRRELQATTDPAELEAGCVTLAKKTLMAAGRREELLSNIERLQMKIDVPSNSVTEPVTCWWPSPPAAAL
jgi:hypothetical protein